MSIKILNIFSFLIALLILNYISYGQNTDKTINDIAFKFSFKLPNGWELKDLKETADKDAISYSYESSDKKMTIMLLAFKLNSVKNIDDFIYNMEKDINLNIPSRTGDYKENDFGKYDMKHAEYKDNKYYESIYYFRTKLPESPNNYVYMLRFITEQKDYNTSKESEIKSISDSFKSTAE